MLYLTGHADPSGSRLVTEYRGDGFQRDLPSLIRGRSEHACSGYYDDQDYFVLLVVGGKGDNSRSK